MRGCSGRPHVDGAWVVREMESRSGSGGCELVQSWVVVGEKKGRCLAQGYPHEPAVQVGGRFGRFGESGEIENTFNTALATTIDV